MPAFVNKVFQIVYLFLLRLVTGLPLLQMLLELNLGDKR